MHWPAAIQKGKSPALACQIDLMASFAALLGETLPEEASPDGESILPALMGQSHIGRETLVLQARVLSLRKGLWKWTEPSKAPAINRQTNIELGHDPKGKLFYLGDDPGERRDLKESYSEVAEELQRLLNTMKGRR